MKEEYQTQEVQEEETIRVVMVKPGKAPEVCQMGTSLGAMQKVVGGDIECYMPYEDEIALICNEEGKICGLPLNRAVRNENDEIVEIMAGNFFICSAPVEEESFQSLTDQQIKKYMNKFKYPERFDCGAHKIQVTPIRPKDKER